MAFYVICRILYYWNLSLVTVSVNRHIIVTRKASILDMVLCDNMFIIDDIYCTEKFSTSDHCSVSFCITTIFCLNVHNCSFIFAFLELIGITYSQMLSNINWRDIAYQDEGIEHYWELF